MYGKLFASTYTGSMVGSGLNVFAVWGYVIANTRADGHVELNPPIIAATLGCSVEEVKAAIDRLLQPDPDSRNAAEEGRRLVQKSAFLYSVTTYSAYRAMRDDDDRKTYMREYMRDYRAGERGNGGKKDPPEKPPEPPKPPKPEAGPPCPHEQIIAAYHEHLPMLPSVRVWGDKSRKHLAARWREDEVRQDIEWWVKFFKYVKTCPFLIGEKTDFHANLAWLVNPTNMEKVLNGQYEKQEK